MTLARPRNFSVVDVLLLAILILITATIVGVFDYEYDKVWHPTTTWIPQRPPPWSRWSGGWDYLTDRVQDDCVAALAVLGPGLALMALRRWRALTRKDWQRPGLLTLAIVLILDGFHLALNLVDSLQSGLLPSGHIGYHYGFPWCLDATGIILGTWTMLAISGRWRRPSGWPDRAGRWLGWGWLATYATTMLKPMIFG